MKGKGRAMAKKAGKAVVDNEDPAKDQEATNAQNGADEEKVYLLSSYCMIKILMVLY
jgi:hypothetical protein